MKNENLDSKEKIKDQLKFIKSKIILKKIFNNLAKKNLLNMIKYNKIIKERIDININDYKEYSENYSSIELEIKVNNKFGRFINIRSEDESYFHIYFNDNKDEIKRYYAIDDEQIKNIKIIIDYQIKSLNFLFYRCDNIESIYFKKFYRNNINKMKCLFGLCSSL